MNGGGQFILWLCSASHSASSVSHLFSLACYWSWWVYRDFHTFGSWAGIVNLFFACSPFRTPLPQPATHKHASLPCLILCPPFFCRLTQSVPFLFYDICWQEQESLITNWRKHKIIPNCMNLKLGSGLHYRKLCMPWSLKYVCKVSVVYLCGLQRFVNHLNLTKMHIFINKSLPKWTESSTLCPFSHIRFISGWPHLPVSSCL